MQVERASQDGISKEHIRQPSTAVTCLCYCSGNNNLALSQRVSWCCHLMKVPHSKVRGFHLRSFFLHIIQQEMVPKK